RANGYGAAVVLSLFATPRSDCYGSGWLRAYCPQLVVFHASEVSLSFHRGTDSEALRSKDVDRPPQLCDVTAARQARRARRRGHSPQFRGYRLGLGADSDSRKGREIGPTAIAPRCGSGLPRGGRSNPAGPSSGWCAARRSLRYPPAADAAGRLRESTPAAASDAAARPRIVRVARRGYVSCRSS